MFQTGVRRQHNLPIFINIPSVDDNEKVDTNTSPSSRWAGGNGEDWQHFEMQEIADEDEPVYPATATYYRLENSSGYHGRRDTFIRQRRPYISLMIVLVLVYTTIWRKEGILAQVMRLPHNISAAKMIPSISHILSARVVEDIMPSLSRIHGDDTDDDEEVVGRSTSILCL